MAGLGEVINKLFSPTVVTIVVVLLIVWIGVKALRGKQR